MSVFLFLKPLIESFEKLNKKHVLIREKDKLLVGLSAGPDSVALCYFLSKIQKKYSLKIVAAHVNHAIDKKMSRQYETLARETAKELGFGFVSAKVNVPALAKAQKRSLEDAGRFARYSFFEKAAGKMRCSKIVTAHTLDDQAETVLFRVLRGSGLRGLEGVEVIRRQGKYALIRPFLNTKKSDILLFLKKNKLRYIVDPSNKDKKFTRNRLRHEVLPALRRHINPSSDEALASLACIASEVNAWLRPAVDRAFATCVTVEASCINIKVSKFKKYSAAIQGEILMNIFDLKRDVHGHWTHEHVRALLDLCQSRDHTKWIMLPGKNKAFFGSRNTLRIQSH